MKKTEKIEQVLKGIKVIGVTAPATIARIAKEQGLNPQEVYVRLIYNYQGEEFTASQKLSILGKTDYEKLRSLAGKEETIDISLNVGKNSKGELSAFFYIYQEVPVEDLFKEPIAKTTRAAAPKEILATLLGK